MTEIPDGALLETWAAAADEYAQLSSSDPAAGVASGPGPSAADRGGTCPPLILTGMHRSATSLFAEFLLANGVDMGRRLLGPLPSNPRGHFEDLEFAEIHEAALLRSEGKRGLADQPALSLTAEEIERLRSLVAQRKSRGGPWGFKDPRACLFLEFWRREIPDALFIILLRDPLVVTDSLCRRQEKDTNTVGQNNRALGMWLGYNRRVLQFVREHKDACLLLHVDTALKDPGGIASGLSRRTGYPFLTDQLASICQPQLLHRSPVQARKVGWWLGLRSGILYRRLRALCDR